MHWHNRTPPVGVTEEVMASFHMDYLEASSAQSGNHLLSSEAR